MAAMATADSSVFVGQRFQAAAEAAGEAIAVQDRSVSWTYRELLGRAEAVAEALRSRGLGPGDRVGVCLPRCVELAAAVLGVNRCGAAYVPLDASHPPGRRAGILADSGVKVLIARDVAGLDLHPDVALLGVPDTPASEVGRPVGVEPDDVAYVIYTSGSTGRPKGVLVSQENLARLFSSTAAWFAFGPRDVWPLFHSIAFDFAVWELWGCLVHAGRLVIPSADLVRDPGAFHDLVISEQVTVLNQTPTAFRSFLDAHRRAGLPDTRLRRIVLGGEALNPLTLAPWFERHGDEAPQVANMYGITETTVHTTYRRMRVGDCGPGAPSVIGVPLPDLAVELRGEDGGPVSEGATGEMFVLGPGVALGYLNRPEETALRFSEPEGSAGARTRLYRSGDLAYRLPNGELAFVGRRDGQLKIRGFRIEPGEIERTLVQVPGVRDAVVRARGGDRLVAWVVPDVRPGPTPDQLREALRPRLPDYMLPAAFVRLDALPRNANDKLDVDALPVPSEADHPRPSAPRAVSSDAERVVVGVVQEVLGLQDLSPDDDILRLGGTSLDVARIAQECGQRLGVELAISEVFRNPKLSDLARRGEAKAPAARPARGRSSVSPRPGAEGGEGEAPLSFAQQRLWLVEELGEGLGPAPVTACLRIRGALDRQALERSVEALVERHAILRTVYERIDGRLRQRVLSPGPIAMHGSRVEARKADDVGAVAAQEVRRLTQCPLDLSRAPPLRVSLLEVDEAEHLLVLWVHHIAADAWSMGVLLRELGQLYRAQASGGESGLDGVPVQYGDFARWQRRQRQADASDAGLAYWRRQLEGMPAATVLPPDRPRPPVRGGAGRQVACDLPTGLVRALRELSRAHDATLFMSLLTAFQVLIYRHTRQGDIVVGSPLATRSRPGLEGAVGLYLNNLVLRADLSGRPPFREALARVRAVVLGALDHQDVPFEQLVRDLHPERRRNQSPLYQVLFNMYRAIDEDLRLGTLDVEFLPVEDDHAQYDLTLYVIESRGGLSLKAVYDSDLYLDEHVREVLAQYVGLLEQVAAQPERCVDDFSLLTARGRAVLDDPAQTLDEPTLAPVSEVFEGVASRDPELVALRQGARELSYGELASWSAAISRRLPPGRSERSTIAVSGHRSLGLVAAVLGVLRTRHVLLLLDPDLPPERRSHVLRQSGAETLLWVGSGGPPEVAGGSEAPGALGVQHVSPERAADAETHAPGAPAPGAAPACPQPDDPAYVVFTSGSTGRPKGILGSHKGLSHFVAWQREAFAVGAGHRVAQLTAFSFDVVLRDFFLPLTSGATLCLPPDTMDAAGSEVLPWLQQEGITHVHAVPTLARIWLRGQRTELTGSALKAVFFAGEPLLERDALAWRRVFGRACAVVNLYGPTETSLAKCFHVVADPPEPGVQPIGRTLPQAATLLLGPGGTRCGLGEMGEIVIRTPFRSLGYLGEESPTAGFLPNPFSGAAGDLLYRTGDLGRYRVDGVLEILGRLDEQVKVNGVRIELAEVESALAEHWAVGRCAVAARPGKDGRQELHAWVVPASDRPPEAADLRRHLLRRVPAAMLPSTFVEVTALPLLASGKIDRASLPPPPAAGGECEVAYTAPRSEIEARLVEVWEEVLGRRPIGVHDDFFDLGGHSLLALRLVHGMGRALGRSLRLLDLFEATTIAGLADRLSRVGVEQEGGTAVGFHADGSLPPLFALAGIGGVAAFAFLDLAEALGAQQPVYGLELQGFDGLAEPHGSVEEMAAYQLGVVQSIQPRGPYSIIGYSFGGRLALEMALQLQARGERVGLLMMIDSSAPGYPRVDPLRVRLQLHAREFLSRGWAGRTSYAWERLRRVVARGGRVVGKLMGSRPGRGSPRQRRLARFDRLTRRAALAYRPSTYEGDMVLFRSSERPRWLGTSHEDPCNGWGRFVSGEIRVHPIPGRHLDIFEEPTFQHLVRGIRSWLRRSREAPVTERPTGRSRTNG
jgi:amino acid adenylation domain-containing protein